jgi:RNA polymerase sigma factor (sigma-70 family)
MAGNLERLSVAEPAADIEYAQDPVQAAARVTTQYEPFIRAVIRTRIRDASREEDVFQELFLRLVERPVPANVANVRAYLYRVIVNDTIDLVRRQERYRNHLQKYSETSRISIHKQPSRDAIEETHEKNSVFAHVARHLRYREAQVMIMRYRDDYSIAEIAGALGVHRRTVSRYLTSGLRELRRVLAVR